MLYINAGGHSILELDLDSRCTCDKLDNLEVFNFGLIHAEFGGLLPLVEHLHQKFLCFAAKVPELRLQILK